MSAGGDALGIAIRDAINAVPLGTVYDAAKRDQIMKGIGNAIYDSGGLTPVAHTHNGVSPNGPKLVQTNTHESADTDAAAASLHHTLGTGANQACAGNYPYSKAETITEIGRRNAGLRLAPTYTVPLDGTIVVDPVAACLFDNATQQGHPGVYAIAGVTFYPPEGSTSYIVADYNGGVPVLAMIPSVATINESDIVPVLTVTRVGLAVFALNWDSVSVGLPNKLHMRAVKTQRFLRESGIVLSELAVRRIVITAGRVWYGATFVDTLAVDSSSTPVLLHYHAAGVWASTPITQYENAQYDDGTNLQPLLPNKFVVNWVWRTVAENVNQTCVVLSDTFSRLSDAVAAKVPTPPAQVTALGILVGRIIVQSGAATATQIDNTGEQQFTPSGVQNHNDLALIDGGDATYRGHLTAAEYAALHARSHGIASTSDHTSAITADRILVSDANGLPSGTIYTNANLASAVGNAHNQFLWPQYSTAVSVTAASTRIIVGVSDTTAPRIVTLLTSQCVAGRIYQIKDESLAANLTNYIKIIGQGGQLLDGLSEIRIVTPGGAAWLYSNGTAWFTHAVEKTGLARETTAVSITASIYADSVSVTDTAAVRTITLATAECAKVGRRYTVSDDTGAASAFPIQVVGQGGELLNGAGALSLGDWGSVTVEATGTAWRIVAISP